MAKEKEVLADVADDAIDEIKDSVDDAAKKQAKDTTVDPAVDETDKGDEKGESKVDGFKGKFTQFQAKDINEYVEKLEGAYVNSSREGVKLNGELSKKEQELQTIAKLVGDDPELKANLSKKLYDTGIVDPSLDDDEELTPSVIARLVVENTRKTIREELPNILQSDPALRSISEEKSNKDRDDIATFTQEHPELMTNQQLADDMEVALTAVAQMDRKKGIKFDFATGLPRAWKMVSQDSDAELNGMKKQIERDSATTSQAATGQGPNLTSNKKRELTDAEKSVAAKFGLSEKDYLEGKELINS